MTGRRAGDAAAGLTTVTAASASSATGVLPRLHLQLELLLRLLEELERLLLPRQRAIRALRLELGLGRLHLLGRLRQELGDLLERRIRRHQPAVHPLDQSFHLLAEAALRQRQDGHAFAEGRGRSLLAIPLQLEGAGNDLALLL